jgi:hypothetical protein
MITSAIAIKILTVVMAAVILIGVGSFFVASALEGVMLVGGVVALALYAGRKLMM